MPLATLGGVLEFYDFIIFVFFANTIGNLFFPPGIPDWVRQFQTFGIFAAGYLARPLGGVVMAHAGDLHGRKKIFTLSVFLMALPTLGIGLLPTYGSLGAWAPILLLLLRILQGAVVGGEVPGAWVFVTEHVPPSRVGLACGILTSGLTVGILLGSLVATGLNMLMPPEQVTAYGWRIPFLLGGAFGLMSMYLRYLLTETPVFEELRKPAIVVVILMTPALLQKMYNAGTAATLQANCVATISLAAGCVLAGWLTDRFGTARVLLVGGPLSGLATYLLGFGVGIFLVSAGSRPSWVQPEDTKTES